MAPVLALLIALLLSIQNLRADTTWVAAGNISGTWNAADSPFMIHAGDVTVPIGVTLVINPGVTVYFSGPYRFVVRGRLNAMGALGDSIRFTTDTLANPDRWRGIRFLTANSASIMRYSIVELGYATEPGDNRYGGGIECQACNPTFERCTIRNCYALSEGGGIYCRDLASAIFRRCDIYGNHSEWGGGGGIMCRNSTVIIDFCVIRNNSSSHDGGGIDVSSRANPFVTNCSIRENRGRMGGGLHIEGMLSSLTVTASDIVDNYATFGGGLYDSTRAVSFTNCVFAGNSAWAQGGAIYCCRDTNSVFDFCTFYGNSSGNGGTAYLDHSRAKIRSSILTHSTDGEGVYFDLSNNARIEYCNVFDHPFGDFAGNVPAGTGLVDRVNFHDVPCDIFSNISEDPLFADAEGGNFRLSDNSPCISSGALSNTIIVDHDAGVRPRPALSQADIGAYENALGGGYSFVCGNLRGSLGPGSFLVACDIAVAANETLILRPGTHLMFGGRFKLTVNGTLLAQGTQQDSIYFTRYRSDDTLGWCGIQFSSGSQLSQMEYCAVEWVRNRSGSPSPQGAIQYISSAPHLSHCSIRNNIAQTGGGILCSSASPTLDSCTIVDNAADFDGGGICCSWGSAPVFNGCIINENIAVRGGGLFTNQGTTRLNQCMISGNVADSGSGVYFSDATAILAGCTITENQADVGGGVFAQSGTPRLTNCLITTNSAASKGAGVASSNSSMRIDSCTLVSNTTPLQGGGVYGLRWHGFIKHTSIHDNDAADGGGVYFEGETTNGLMDSCVIRDNTAQRGAGIFLHQGFPTMRHSTVFSNTASDSGGGVFLNGRTTPIIQNCTVAENTAPVGNGFCLVSVHPRMNSCIVAQTSGTTFYVRGPCEASEIRFSDFYTPGGNGIEYFGNDATQGPVGFAQLARVNINSDSSDAYQNIFLNPVFVNNSGDFHLQDLSPCINAGDTTFPCEEDETLADQGAYHFHVSGIPPTPFDLLAPVDGDTLSEDSVTFCWQRSFFDNGYCDNVLRYILHLTTEDTSIIRGGLVDTCLLVTLEDLLVGDSSEVTWYVEARITTPDTTTLSSSIRHFFFLRETDAHEPSIALPSEFALHPNFPNPFNYSTVFRFDVPRAAHIRIQIYDVTGRLVETLIDQMAQPGVHNLTFDGSRLASGIYFARFDAGEFVQTQKMVLLK